MRAAWKAKPLGEVLRLEYGKPLDDRDRKPHGLYPIYGANGEIGRTDKFYFDEPSIIVGRKGSAGALNLTEGKFWPLDVTYFVTCDKQQYEVRFLYYFLLTLDLPSLARGVKPGINRNEVYSLVANVPALPEQRRIARTLDEALEGVATAKANAENNLHNARALFQSRLQSVLTQRNGGWVEKSLGEMCSIARGGSPRPIKKFLTSDPQGINWIKIGDATASGKYIYTTAEKIIRAGAKRSRIVRDGDFLLSNSMSFGRPYIMRTTGCVHDGWLVLSGYASCLDQDYLYYVLGSPLVYQQFDSLAAGSTVRNLNIELASRVRVPVPPLARQRTISQELGILFSETEHLESLYQRKLDALDALKSSLLHEAFTGDL